MIDIPRLRGLIAERGLSQSDVAKALGITPATMCYKMEKGTFKCNEAEQIIHLLDIKDPVSIFFTTVVT